MAFFSVGLQSTGPDLISAVDYRLGAAAGSRPSFSRSYQPLVDRLREWSEPVCSRLRRLGSVVPAAGPALSFATTGEHRKREDVAGRPVVAAVAAGLVLHRVGVLVGR
jgi:hypothetical protein